MKKSIILGTSLAAITALGLAVATAAEEPIVNVFNWSDYIDEEILTDFEKETGIKVVYDVFDSDEMLETKLLAGGTGYDVVVPSASFMARQIEAGAFMPLNTSKLPNEKNMWPVVKKQVAAFDPGNKFSVNYMWGTTGIGLNIDMVRERIGEDLMSSWDMILDPEVASKLQDCGIFWLDAPNEMLPVVLNYVGRNPASFEKEDIKTAMEVMSEVRSTVRKFHSSEYINALANGDICVAVGWSGDVLQARERAAEAGNGVNVDYVIPWEGAVMWFD